MIGALGLLVLANGMLGAAPVSAGQVLAALLARTGLVDPPEPALGALLWGIRFPRVLLGLLVGAALSVGGALLQGVFRNPLADPGVLGVSGGAALGAAAVQVFAGHALLSGLPAGLHPWLMSLAAFGGALGATALVARLGQRDGERGPEGLLLAGMVVNAGAGALLALLFWLAGDAALRGMTAWMMGGLGGATPEVLAVVGPIIALALALAWRLHRPLDALLLGEAEAGALGFDGPRVRRRAVGLVALMVGAAVSVSGIIGFVGLIVPQLVRLAIGATHRTVLAGALLAGPALLLLADLGARTLASPAELPVGVLTGLVGTPVFAALLRRRGA